MTGGKNEKARWGGLHEKLQLDLYFAYRKHWIENQNNLICDMSTRGFLIEILLHIYNVQQTEVISGFLFTVFSHKLLEHLLGVSTVS